MRLLYKLTIATVIILSFPKQVNSQYVQPMRYDHYSFTQQVNIGVGTSRLTNPSAYLEVGPVTGANKGLLPPRLTAAQMNAIASPAAGLFVYNTDSAALCYYNGSIWKKINSGSGVWSTTGNPNTDSTVNFIGTTDNKSLFFRVNNEPAGLIISRPSGPTSLISGGLILGHNSGQYLTDDFISGATPHIGNNILIGYQAGRFLGRDWGASGRPLSGQNTFVGLWSGYMTQVTNGGGGQYGRNVGLGESTLVRNISGSDNTATGSFALEANDNGDANTAFGRDALRSNVSGNYNAAVGHMALGWISTGVQSCTITNPGSGYTTASVTFSAPGPGGSGLCNQTATGTVQISGGSIIGITITNPGCGYSTSTNLSYTGWFQYVAPTATITGDGVGGAVSVNLSSATGNVGIGLSAGIFAKMPQDGVYIGREAGLSNRFKDTGSIMIGYHADIDASIPTSTDINKSVAIGYNAKVAASNTMVLGGTGVDAIKVAIGKTSTNYGLDVAHTNGAMIDSIRMKAMGTWTGTILWPDTSHPVTNPSASMAIGVDALANAPDAGSGFNLAVGYKTMEFLTGSGKYHNTGVGTMALRNMQGSSITAIGAYSFANTTNLFNFSVAVGAWAGYSLREIGQGGVSGNGVTAVGYAAMSSSKAGGEFNTAVGSWSGNSLIGGRLNTSLGTSSLGGGSGIAPNPIGGTATLYGAGNTAIGFAALAYTGSSSTDNTAIGRDAGQNTQGNGNIYLGAYAGKNQGVGSYNVIIGSNTGTSIMGASRQILIADGEGNQRMKLDSAGDVRIQGDVVTVNNDNDTLATKADVRAGGGGGNIVDGGSFSTSNNYLTITQSVGSDIGIRIAPSFIVNPINADSTSFKKNDSTLLMKAVSVVAANSKVTVSSVRNDSTITHTIGLAEDTITIASFGAGSGAAGDTTAFSTSAIYGSFYNSGSDTLVITSSCATLQGSSANINYTIYYNDTLNVVGTTVVTDALTSTTTADCASVSAVKIPPGNWVWVKSTTVTTKPTYFSLSLIGYKKRVY